MTSFYSKHKKLIMGLVVMLSILGALKTIFVCLCVDEEYQITMGYRLLCGEKLFVDMWDPHQTSAFLTEFLMWVYKSLFSTYTGVIIWVRFWGCIIHLVASLAVYRVIKDFLNPEYAFFLSALYFNLLPKNSILPDYSLMFVWSLTFLLVHLYFLDRDGHWWHALICGLWMCVMVLSYPSAGLLFFAVLVVLLSCRKNKIQYSTIFILTCMAGGGAYFVYAIRVTGSVNALIDSVHYIANSHTNYAELSPVFKIKHYLSEIFICAILCGIYCLCSKAILFVISRLRKRSFTRSHFMLLSLTIALVHHIFHWILMLWTYEYGYNYAFYFLVLLFAIISLKKMNDRLKKTAIIWVSFSLIELICVLMLTDLTVYASAKYMIPGVVIGISAILKSAATEEQEHERIFPAAFLLLFCLSAVFVKAWQYQASGGVMFNITDVRGIIKQGPAKGILTEYMNSFISRSTYEEFEELIPENASLLIVDESSIAYMYKDVEVSSYSTICDSDYNELLLEYWESHPEKYPDVIAVSCWYGELHWDPNSWICKWIENEYKSETIVDGKYYRYYFGGDGA